MSSFLFNTTVLMAILSVFFDSNIFQLIGFIFALSLALNKTRNWQLASLTGLLSLTIIFLDNSGMGSKTILLLYLYYEAKNMGCFTHSDSINTRVNQYLYYAFVISLPVTFHQMILGDGAYGAFDLIRGSAYFWDPNYFSILLLSLSFVYSTNNRFFITYVIIGQTLTTGIAYLVYKIKPFMNLLILIMVIFLYFMFSQVNFSELSDYGWLSERIYSFSIRVEMLQLYMEGDLLDGAAPHMSFLSGYKKNAFTTILFFLSIPFLSREKNRLWMYLVISMTYDVFFGPLCFLIPFAINSKARNTK